MFAPKKKQQPEAEVICAMSVCDDPMAQINALPHCATDQWSSAIIRVGSDSDVITHVLVQPVRSLSNQETYFQTSYLEDTVIPYSEREAAMQNFPTADEAYNFIVTRATALNNFFRNFNKEENS